MKLKTVALLVLVMTQLSACAVNVKAWERGILAKDHMSLQPGSQIALVRQQCQYSKEGTSGGYGGGVGGCGCN